LSLPAFVEPTAELTTRDGKVAEPLLQRRAQEQTDSCNKAPLHTRLTTSSSETKRCQSFGEIVA